MTRTVSTDRVVIVGAGLAALFAAIELAPRAVLVISPERLGQGASSAWAQGGVAAAMDAADSPAAHARDTVAAGAGTVDEAVAREITRMARPLIERLAAMGAPFDRDCAGRYAMSREGAHSTARVVRVHGDQAGRRIMETLIAAVRATPSVQVLEDAILTEVETANGAVTGVILERASRPSMPVTIRARRFLFAGGGSAGLYALTTNPPRIRGEIIGAAARAGARIADAEFVQFHPTAFDIGEDPAPLATEALRGEGAVLVNRQGVRFMTAVHPDAELAPRDIVARAVFAESAAGNRPMLDTRLALGRELRTRFPVVSNICLRVGIDPVRDCIPVAAAAHYHMGGIETDMRGRASLGNLWVCGEAGSTGFHGANRLASNGLLEALVMARICAADIAGSGYPLESVPEVRVVFEDGGHAPSAALVADLRGIMTQHAGVTRTAAGLIAALGRISRLETRAGGVRSVLNMTATATLIAAAALLREESRGSHFRADFPFPRPPLASRSCLMLEDARTLRGHVAETAA